MTQSHSDLILKARPYQKKAIEEVRSLFASGKKRVLLQLATGAGKTFVFSCILQMAQKRNVKSIMVVRGRALVDQASRRLEEHGIDHSVFMAGDKRYNKESLIQIVSVDTCISRKEFPEAELVIIDEAHTATSESFTKFLSNYQDAFWLSVTATPWTKEGLKCIADDVVYPVSIKQLVDDGYLVPPKIYIASTFDTSGLKMQGGDYSEATALDAFNKQGIYGDVVGNYMQHCADEYTWVYAINIDHAVNLSEKFEDAGFNTVIITGETPIFERTKLLEENKLVISIGTLTTGVDLPKLRNLIICRPTRSRNLYVQMLGRGTRPYPGKEYFRVFDHVGNYREFGNILHETVADLEPAQKSPARSKLDSDPQLKACPSCNFGVHPATKECPECGHAFKITAIKVVKNDVMIEVKDDEQAEFAFKIMGMFETCLNKGYKIGYVWHKANEAFGMDGVKKMSTIYWRIHNIYKKKIHQRDSQTVIYGRY